MFTREVAVHRVFVAHNPIEAHFVKDMLERAGIGAEVQGDCLFGLRPEIGISSDSLPAVWISEDAELQAALELVAEFQHDKNVAR